MTNENISLDEILYRNAAPWHPENSVEEKFPSLLHEVKEVEPAYPFTFKIEFERPINNKTKYYYKRIINEAIETVNQFHQIISENDNPQIRAFWLNKVLEKKLQTKLKDIGQLIKEKDYSFSYINPKKASFDIDQDHKANTFIIQLLKLAYMQVYLELQEAFKDHIKDLLIEDDFYTQLLLEPVPDQHYLKKIQVIEVEPTPIVANEPKPIYAAHFSFTYKEVDTHPDKLNDLCDSLKKNNFIAQDTNLANFKKVFSGKEVTAPVVWTGNPSEFAYFIKLIYNKHKYVEDLKQKQWKVALLCFVDRERNPFPETTRKLQKPKLSAEAIEKCVSHMA